MTQKNEETALTVTEVKLETINHPKGARELARDAKGKFARTAIARAERDVKDAQKFLAEVDPDPKHEGKTRKQVMREALYKGAIDAAANPKGLGNAVKAIQFFEDESGNTKAKESLMADDNIKVVPRTVIVVAPPDIKPMEDRKPERTVPTFAEVLGITTNPLKE